MVRMPSRRILWTTAVTIAVLAVVIIVLGAISPLWSSRKSGSTRPVASGDATGQFGVGLPAPGSSVASTSVAATSTATSSGAASTGGAAASGGGGNSTGGSSSGNGSNTAQSTPVDDAAFLKNYKDLRVLMPASFKGFDFGPPAQIGDNITLSGSPVSLATPASRILWSVHDAQKPSSTKTEIRRRDKVLYSKDAKTITVHGSSAYFGTDGMRFAAVAFGRGRYTFEVLVTANGDPKKTLKIATQAAEAFPTSPAK